MAKDLSSVAMVASLGFSAYGASKKDKARSKELVESSQAASNRAKVEKKLIDVKEEKTFAALQNHKIQMGIYHRKVTLPWFDDGSRILPVSRFEEYSTYMRQAIERFWELVDEFVAEYPNIIQRERAKYTKLGNLWNSEDYLPANEIRAKFNVRANIFPLPNTNDFRVTVRHDEIEDLRKQYESGFNNLLKEAKRELFERLYSTVKVLADNIRNEDKKFKDASVNNICELCDLLAELNIDEDKDIETMRQRILDGICVSDIDKLRKDKSFRSEISKEADSILEDMAGYLA